MKNLRFNLPPFYILWLLFGLTLGSGSVLLNNHVINQNTFFILLLLGAGLPPLAVLAMGVRRLGQPISLRLAVLFLLIGATLSVGVALVLESILPILVYVLMGVLGPLGDWFGPSGYGQPDLVERLFFSPRLVLFLLFVALQAPIPEEYAKLLGPLLLGPRLKTERQAFLAGLAAGAGFAILENVLYEGLYAQWNGWSWGGVTALRASGAILHPLCTGMLSLAVFRARQNPPGSGGGDWKRVGLVYLQVVLLHTLWNGGFGPLVYLTGLDTYMGGGPSFSIYGVYIQALLVVYLAVLAGFLWFIFMRFLRRLGQEEAVEAAPALVTHRALALGAVLVAAALVPAGAMLGPSWPEIRSAAVGGLPTRTPTPTLIPTATPTVVPTPTPRPVVYQIDFSEDTGSWSVQKAGSFTAFDQAIDNGKFVFNLVPESAGASMIARLPSELRDFILAVDVEQPADAPSLSGLAFRISGSSGYIFAINPKERSFLLFANLPTGRQKIVKRQADAILSGGTNHLEVRAAGSMYELIINSKSVGSYSLGLLQAGNTGLYVEALEGGVPLSVSFDNFVVIK